MSALKHFKVLDNPEKDISELNEIKEIATQQLEKANITGAYISEKVSKEISAKVSDFLTQTLESYSLTVPAINIDVNARTFTVQATASTVGTTGMDIFHAEYLHSGEKYGLKPEWLGASFVHKAKKPAFLTVTGLDLTRDKPYVRFLQIQNGKQTTVKTEVKDSLAEQIGLAITKYNQAFLL